MLRHTAGCRQLDRFQSQFRANRHKRIQREFTSVKSCLLKVLEVDRSKAVSEGSFKSVLGGSFRIADPLTTGGRPDAVWLRSKHTMLNNLHKQETCPCSVSAVTCFILCWRETQALSELSFSAASDRRRRSVAASNTEMIKRTERKLKCTARSWAGRPAGHLCSVWVVTNPSFSNKLRLNARMPCVYLNLHAIIPRLAGSR